MALSGEGLGQIASDSLRVLMARWPGAYADLVENEELELRLIEHDLYPLLRRRVSIPDLVAFTDAATPTQALTTSIAGSERLRRTPDAVSLREGLTSLAGDREFEGLLYQLLFNEAAILEEYGELLQLIDSIALMIDRSVGHD